MPPRHPEIARALGLVRPVLRATRRSCGVSEQTDLRVVVACSGGRDSIALLGLLALLRVRDGLEVSVAHIDHGVRPTGPAEAAHVANASAALGVEMVSTRLDLAPGPGLPQRARDARHAYLREVAEQRGAHRVALAHTATDQAETLLLHLSRGAGLRGLGAMRSVESTYCVRPLLELTREETTALCGHLGLAYVDDPTNTSRASPRVRMREVVLPALAAERGGVEAALAASARAAREADEALEGWAQRERAARDDGSGLDVAAWSELPRAVRTRLLRAWLLAADVTADVVGRRGLEALDLGALAGGRKEWDMSGGLCVQLAHRRLVIARRCVDRTPPCG